MMIDLGESSVDWNDCSVFDEYNSNIDYDLLYYYSPSTIQYIWRGCAGVDCDTVVRESLAY